MLKLAGTEYWPELPQHKNIPYSIVVESCLSLTPQFVLHFPYIPFTSTKTISGTALFPPSLSLPLACVQYLSRLLTSPPTSPTPPQASPKHHQQIPSPPSCTPRFQSLKLLFSDSRRCISISAAEIENLPGNEQNGKSAIISFSRTKFRTLLNSSGDVEHENRDLARAGTTIIRRCPELTYLR